MATDLKLNPADTWQACVQTLHKHIHQTANDRCILWVNPAQSDMFEDNALVQDKRVRVPIQHPRFDQQFAPYLLELDVSTSADSDLLEQSVQAAFQAWELPSLQAYSGQPICGWIIASSPVRELASYWASFTHLHTVGTLTKLLRFHDPSVREWLWSALSEHQKTQLLGPAEQLISLDRQQSFLVHQRQPNSPAADSNMLRLQKSQWLEIEDYAVVHQAWLMQAKIQEALQLGSPWRKTLPAQWQHGVLNALQKATNYGVNDEQDRVLFAQHAIALGTDFHTHALLKDVWQKTREGSFYGGAVEQLIAQPAAALPKYLSSHTS
jgi:hypothetical protein